MRSIVARFLAASLVAAGLLVSLPSSASADDVWSGNVCPEAHSITGGRGYSSQIYAGGGGQGYLDAGTVLTLTATADDPTAVFDNMQIYLNNLPVAQQPSATGSLTLSITIPARLQLTSFLVTGPMTPTGWLTWDFSCRPPVNFSAFDQPVDPDIVNIAKAGRSIPFRFRLTDESGAPITNVTDASGLYAPYDCGSRPPAGSDAIENYSTSTAGLVNQGDGWYQYNFKTVKSWQGCVTLGVAIGHYEKTAVFFFG